jgi:hypothetical protein
MILRVKLWAEIFLNTARERKKERVKLEKEKRL